MKIRQNTKILLPGIEYFKVGKEKLIRISTGYIRNSRPVGTMLNKCILAPLG